MYLFHSLKIITSHCLGQPDIIFQNFILILLLNYTTTGKTAEGKSVNGKLKVLNVSEEYTPDEYEVFICYKFFFPTKEMAELALRFDNVLESVIFSFFVVMYSLKYHLQVMRHLNDLK